MTQNRHPTVSEADLHNLVSQLTENLAHQEQLLAGFAQDETDSNIWCPKEVAAPKLEALTPQRVREVQKPNDPPDAFIRLTRGKIGLFYRQHLKRIPHARAMVIWLWRLCYPTYLTISARVRSRQAQRWFPLVKLQRYVETTQGSTVQIFGGTRVDTPPPKIFPVADQKTLSAPHDHYVFPPVYVAEVNNVQVYGGTNLIFAQNAVICHDLYDFSRDYTSEELHGRHAIDTKKMRVRRLHDDEVPEKITVGAAFVDACSPNYAHWLTEVLPRIAAFCTLEQFASVPIVVNGNLHRNIMESLAIVTGQEREIIVLPVGRAVTVDRLYVTSVAGYVPFEKRDAKLSNHSHGLFCPPALKAIRDQCLPFIDQLPRQEWPRKIYIRRNAGVRRVTNCVEIEKLLRENGYDVVEPEKLSFVQQAALFSNAEHICGSSGAALANILFASPTADTCILIGKHEDAGYWYWQNIACSSGNSVKYFHGTPREKNLGIHSDISIDIELFAASLLRGKDIE